MDDDIHRKHAAPDKLFRYIAEREKKDLFRVMKPELPRLQSEKGYEIFALIIPCQS